MINGAHFIIYSKDAAADRAFLRDVLGLPYVDARDGWLIFSLPPAEIAVHPADPGGTQALSLMCEDVEAFIASMKEHGIACKEPTNQGWGIMTRITLPGGSELGVYQPRHARPPAIKT